MWIIFVPFVLMLTIISVNVAYGQMSEPVINWSQSIVTGLIAATGLFVANYILERLRYWHNRANLKIDNIPTLVTEPIDLEIYNIEDPALAKNLEDRNFKVKYVVNRLKVTNNGRQAVEDCKAVLNDGEDKKICWNVPTERYRMTINSKSFEYIDVCAILESKSDPEKLAKEINNRREHR